MGCLKSKDRKSHGARPTTSEARVILLGDIRVGKSSIHERYLINKSIGDDNYNHPGFYNHKEVVTEGGQKIKLRIWDTCGDERYRAIAPLYYRGAQAALLVYDITDVSTFHSLDYWLNELNRNVRGENMILFMAGNKNDLPGRKVTEDQARIFADNNGLDFFEVSAKTGANINELFGRLAQQLVNQQKKTD